MRFFTMFLFTAMFFVFAAYSQEVAITTATGDQIGAQVSAGDECFFVVWEDHRAGVSNTNIYGQSIYPDGTLGGPGFPICITPASNQTSPVIAYNSTSSKFLNLWYDHRSGTQLYARNTDCTGTDGDEWLIADGTTNLSAPEMASSNSNYIYTWMVRSGMYFETKYIVLDTTGAPVGAIQSLSGPGSMSPAVAFDGEEFLIVWQDSLAAGAGIYGKYFDSTGTPIGAAFLIVDDADAYAPDVCAIRGSVGEVVPRFAIAWQHYDAATNADIYAGILEHLATSEITGIAVSTADNAQSSPAIGFHGYGLFVAWEDQRGGSTNDIYGRFLGLTGSPSGSEFAVCDEDLAQQAPKLAYSTAAEKYLCVWTDMRSGAYSDIYGAILAPPPPSTGPSVTSVSPTDGTISGCDTLTMQISISSEHGIDDTTIIVSLNGVNYTLSDTELSLDGMTINFSPDYIAGTIETMNVCLETIEDEAGSPIESPYCWSWIWDDVAPQITSTNPSNGESLDDIPTTITAAMSDEVAGIDEATITANVNGTEFSTAETGVYWDGYTLTLNLSEMGYSTLPETNVVIFDALDEAECPNEMLDTLVFYVVSNPGPVAYAQVPLAGEIVSCDDQQIQISITDDDGVNASSIELSVNGTPYSFPDHLSFSDPILIFTPDPVFSEGTVYVQLDSCEDMSGNPLSTPLNYNFIIDLSPPTIISSTYPAETIIDSTSDTDFVVIADDNFCDSLKTSICYVMVTNDGAMIARWEGDAFTDIGDFTFTIPASSFLDSISGSAEGTLDTFGVCIHLADSPDRCSPNLADTCWEIYYQISGINEVKIPENISLSVSPNPFNANLDVEYSAPDGGKIEIFDGMGHRIYNFSVRGAGTFIWDGCDEEGMPMQSGIYFIKLRTFGGEISRVVKLVK